MRDCVRGSNVSSSVAEALGYRYTMRVTTALYINVLPHIYMHNFAPRPTLGVVTRAGLTDSGKDRKYR